MKKDPLVLRVVLLGWVASGAVAQLALFASPLVEVSTGKLRGKYVLTREGKKIRAFLGIPYARPPLENLRFRSPEPAEPWDHERLALDHPKPCVQPERRHGEPTGKEDCLYLNVYTPEGLPKALENDIHAYTKRIQEIKEVNETKVEESVAALNTTNDEIDSNLIPQNVTTSSNETATNATAAPGNTTAPANETAPGHESCSLRPVMVYFHGGAFEMGNSEPFTHEYLMDTDVIVVTIQYRLGLLGFLSTGDEVLPGNLGFKDQRLALQWVQENIEHFGGCPERITIFGDGVGGASVHYHMLFTPPSNATFRAGISMSGTALSPWAFRPPSEVMHLADRVAALSGCPRPSQELVHCLRWKPAEELVRLLQEYKNESRDGCGEWVHALPVLGGVLENTTSVPDAFITSSPWDKRVAMPWIVGVTSKELLYEFTPHLVDRKDKLFKELDKCFNETLPKVLGYQFSNASETELAAAVRSFYFDNQHINRSLFDDIVDAVSDGSVVYPAFEAVRRAGRKTTYLYHFDYLGTNTFGPTALDGRIGPGRGDDLFYFFPRPLGKNIPRKTKEPDTVMSRKILKLWTNFATYLDPTPEEIDGLIWVPTTPSTTFLNISQTNMTVERPFLANRMNFWSLQDYPYRDDDYKHDYAPTPGHRITAASGFYSSLPMSMDSAPASVANMGDIIHELRLARINEIIEERNRIEQNETTTVTYVHPGVLVESDDLTVDELAELLQSYRVSQISDMSDLNMLRYMISGHQLLTPKVEEVDSETVVGMADFFHSLRMSQQATDQDSAEEDATGDKTPEEPITEITEVPSVVQVINTTPNYYSPSEG